MSSDDVVDVVEEDLDMYDEDEDYRKVHKGIVKQRIQKVARFAKRHPKPSKKDKIQRGGVREEMFGGESDYQQN